MPKIIRLTGLTQGGQKPGFFTKILSYNPQIR